MKQEIDVLHANKTWRFVDVPPDCSPIGSKWVYKTKRQVDESVEQFKVRLVMKGYNQIE